MLPVTVQFIVAMLAYALNERTARRLDYLQEENRVLKEALRSATGKARRILRRRHERPRRKKADKSKNSKSAFVGVLYTLRKTPDGWEGPINKRLIATFESHDALFRRLHEHAKRRGYGRKRTLFLADGFPAIWARYERYFPKAIPCIDWYHVVEKLWEAGTCLHAEGSKELRAWVHEHVERGEHSTCHPKRHQRAELNQGRDRAQAEARAQPKLAIDGQIHSPTSTDRTTHPTCKRHLAEARSDLVPANCLRVEHVLHTLMLVGGCLWTCRAARQEEHDDRTAEFQQRRPQLGLRCCQLRLCLWFRTPAHSLNSALDIRLPAQGILRHVGSFSVGVCVHNRISAAKEPLPSIHQSISCN
jgi:hypothetical protein